MPPSFCRRTYQPKTLHKLFDKHNSAVNFFQSEVPAEERCSKELSESLSREGFCQNPRGIFSKKFPRKCVIIWGSFGCFFFLGGGGLQQKNRRNKFTPKIHIKIDKSELWEFRGQDLAVRRSHCGSGLRCSQCSKSFSRSSVIVVVPYMRTPLATTWSGSKSSLSRTPAPPGVSGQKPCEPPGEDPPPKFRGLCVCVKSFVCTMFLRGAPYIHGVDPYIPQNKFWRYMGLQILFRLLPFFLRSLFSGICSDLLRFLF